MDKTIVFSSLHNNKKTDNMAEQTKADHKDREVAFNMEELDYLTADLPDLENEGKDIYINIKQWGMDVVIRRLGFDKRKYSRMQLAGRLLLYTLKAPKTIKEYVKAMENRLNTSTAVFLLRYHKELDQAIAEQKHMDLQHDFFSAGTLIHTYLTRPRHDMPPCETPQQMFMRIAAHWVAHSAIPDDKRLAVVINKYKEMSNQLYTPATPALFNAGTTNPQQASCFIISIQDSLHSIYANKYIVAMGSKNNGGWGIDVSLIRHSEIGYSGSSNGLVPMLKSYNDDIRYVNQGGRRKGAANISCRPHHLDIFEFISLVEKQGDQYIRAHDLNISLWCPWIFWQRIREDGMWTLFCPAKTKQLNDVYGKEFEKRYIAAEKDETLKPPYKKVVRARDLYKHIIEMQRKAGMPYICHGDAANIKSNHRHNGYIRSANLCQEVIHYTDADTIGVCNLSSISVRAFAKKAVPLALAGQDISLQLKEVTKPLSTPTPVTGLIAEYVGERVRGDLKGTLKENNLDEIKVATELRSCFDFTLLGQTARSVVENVNMAMDSNKYPLDDVGSLEQGKIRRSNERHRSIGIGVNGLAEAEHILDLPKEHPYTRLLNRLIHACMYFNAVASSIQLALDAGAFVGGEFSKPYPTFAGSPFSQGKLQFDLWAEEYKERYEFLKNSTVRKVEDDLPLDPALWEQKAIVLTKDFPHIADEEDKTITTPHIQVQRREVDTIQPTWADLKRCLMKYGCRNSMFLSNMPTASTAQILRNCESTEAHTSNMYSRKVLSGAYPVLVRGLVYDLQALNLWNDDVANFIQAESGSIVRIHTFISKKYPDFPSSGWERLYHVQRKYKTMWELPQKLFLCMAAEAGRYIDQSQSTNIYLKDASEAQLKAIHLFTEELGLKTGMYYLRQGAVMETLKFTMDVSLLKEMENKEINDEAKKTKNMGDKANVTWKCTDEICTSCSS